MIHLRTIAFPLCAAFLGLCLILSPVAWAENRLTLPVQVTCDAVYPRIPVAVFIDFGAQLQAAGLSGLLNPNTIEVRTVADQQQVAHALSEDFTWGDAGTVSWVMTHPKHRELLLSFSLSNTPVPLASRPRIPAIGTGDLLRYNAGVPRPVVLPYLSGLHDLDGDGRRDLVGCWNYAYRPGLPWDGIVLYPRSGATDRFHFGELSHLRYVTREEPETFRFFSSIYMHAEIADLNGDGLRDIIYSPKQGNTLRLFLNTGRQETGRLPVFEASDSLPRPQGAWNPCRAVDLDLDGAIDLVVGTPGNAQGGYWLRNTNPKGWPITLDAPKKLPIAEGVCFFDVDEDGFLDAVGLQPLENGGVHAYEVVWQRNLGEAAPAFGAPTRLSSLSVEHPSSLAAVNEGPEKGLLLLHQVYQKVSFYPHRAASPPYFGAGKVAQSRNAVMSLSDQAWPNFCDWDQDGDLDILIGGGYGWPRIVINEGSTTQPRYAEAQRILAGDQPIRLLRNEILGEPFHGHNMGYSYPVFEDWDADGLRDIIIPNETNRIFWYRNTGTEQAPSFAPRQQVLVEGYEESEASKRLSAERALKATYPLEAEQPFFWRTGAAVADWNNDGLMDLATHDGKDRHLTLFSQYRDETGNLRLKYDHKLLLEDGRVIDDRIVGRTAHWTESFKPVDWDRDGLLDILYACAGTRPADGSIYLLRNVGSREEAVFAPPRSLNCFGKPIKVTNHGPHPWAGDIDGDGLPDLLTCVEWSVYPFFSHAALEMDAPPAYELGDLRVVE